MYVLPRLLTPVHESAHDLLCSINSMSGKYPHIGETCTVGYLNYNNLLYIKALQFLGWGLYPKDRSNTPGFDLITHKLLVFDKPWPCFDGDFHTPTDS